MKVSWRPVSLPLKDPFTISRGTLRHQDSLLVALTVDGITGYGEVTCNSYYGHTYESLTSSLQKIAAEIEACDLMHPAELYARCLEIVPGDPFARSALDCAAYDLFGKARGLTTAEILELPAQGETRSSYTLGIDSIDEMVRKYRERPNWPIYKIKLGTPHDLDIVQTLRSQTDAVIRVDANCGWTADQAIEYSQALADLGVEFIEQPLPANAPREEHRRVFEKSVLPIIADESCRTEEDVARSHTRMWAVFSGGPPEERPRVQNMTGCHGLFHGINVKLCKCGGLTPAARMLRQARALGMKTMVGCMIESSVGITAAAQLLPLLDYADLDGAVLLSEDIAEGAAIEDGTVALRQLPGSGIELKPELLDESWQTAI